MTEFDLSTAQHDPIIEEIVDVLCNKTQNTDRNFFRAEVAFFIGKMAANMRASVVTKDRGDIPINIYTLALATSGFGKGHSVGIMENEFLAGFKRRFMEEVLPIITEKSLWSLADYRAACNNSDQQAEYDRASSEHKSMGAYPFTFDSGTPPAVKQLRSKLLMSKVGAISMQIDEIGSNLSGSAEMLTLFLELYDQGMVKQKLVKNTAENQRAEEMDGKTPTNMLLFGTPSKLLDGGTIENEFYSFLETGYARRCIFGYGHQDRKAFHSMDAREIYERQIRPTNNVAVSKWATQFTSLADPNLYGWKVVVEDEVAIQLLKYRIWCECRAEAMNTYEEVRKAEMSHRFFKALKLAGAIAFISKSPEMLMSHLMSAILLVEESGTAFESILNREKSYAKLAKYIAENGSELTHADLHEALPFYKSSNSSRNEMMTLAVAWGYRNHIVIKKSFVDGIELFQGKTLQNTDVNKLHLSVSSSFAYQYEPVFVSFDDLPQLAALDGQHWANHAFQNQHRSEENTIPGFDMVVLDVDGGIKIDMVRELLSEYKYVIYTTKRHTDDDHRFRLILPINYYLELDADDYKEFMDGIVEWLPFRLDESANQRSRKWLTNPNAQCFSNSDGKLLNALPFIPKTSKNEQHRKAMQQVESLDNLERWFAQRMATGNRNNNMIKFALALADSGMDLMQVTSQVHAFNKKLSNPLSVDEINTTILKTVASRLSGTP